MASKVKTPVTSAAKTNGSLPKGWRMVRFGDVVRDVNEAERNPLDAGLERFVGLEHIEPENLHLKQWGNLANGDVSFTKRFRKGQVLFGKRRAYQRKVAVAEFDGICSSDILTFEPKDDSLIPELLPFIVQSDGFFQHALGTSSGSLSPRTRWSQLQDFEFPLPPKEEQRPIAEILWATDEVFLRYVDVLSELERTRLLLGAQFYDSKTADSMGVRMVRVRDIGAPERQTVQVGPFGGSVCSRHFRPNGVPVIKVNNINDEGEVSLLDPVFVSSEHALSLERYRVVAGDVLIAAQGDTTGKSGLAGDDVAGGIISQHLIRVAFDPEQCRPRYVAATFCAEPIQRQIKAVKIKTTRPGLNTEDVENFLIPLPPLDVQDKVCEQLERIEHSKRYCKMAITEAGSLRSALINGLTVNVH